MHGGGDSPKIGNEIQSEPLDDILTLIDTNEPHKFLHDGEGVNLEYFLATMSLHCDLNQGISLTRLLFFVPLVVCFGVELWRPVPPVPVSFVAVFRRPCMFRA